MHILFISPFLVGPNVNHAGGRDIYHLLRSLSEHHEISAAFLVNTSEEMEQAREILHFCKYLEVVVLGTAAKETLRRYVNCVRWPRGVAMAYSADFDARLRAMVAQKGGFDIVQYENVQVLPYSRAIRLPGVLDCIDLAFLPLFQNCLSGKGSLLKRIYWHLEWPRLQLFESHHLLRFQGVLVRSERDATIVRALHPTASVKIMESLPYTVNMRSAPSHTRPKKRPQKPVVMFVGAMWRSENYEAAHYCLQHIWPIVLRTIPDAELRIVGGSPPSHLARHDGKNNVRITGYVDDLTPFYDQCSIAIAPLSVAGGVITRIADAMCIGIPVVATPVANHGTGAVPGRDILTADRPDKFAQSIISLLQSDELYRRISENAENFIETRFDWRRSVAGIEELYEKVIGRHRSKS